MREIVLDTETTGLNPNDGHKIIEIAALEIIDFLPTGNTFHKHIYPERDIPQQSTDIHGITIEILKNKPIFRKIVDEFLNFISNDPIIAHNVEFDIGFINHELRNCDREILKNKKIDTVAIAREKYPGQSVSLDALCKKLNVDNQAREKHSAILDTQLLAKVYIELLDKREPSLDLHFDAKITKKNYFDMSKIRNRTLVSRLTDEEEKLHEEFIESLGPNSIWKRITSN